MGIFNNASSKIEKKVSSLADNIASARVKDFKARDFPEVEINKSNFKELKEKALNNAQSMRQTSEVKDDIDSMKRVHSYPSIWNKKGTIPGVFGGAKMGLLAIPAYGAFQAFDSGTTAMQKKGTTSEKIRAGIDAVDEDTFSSFFTGGVSISVAGMLLNYGKLLDLRGVSKMQKYLK